MPERGTLDISKAKKLLTYEPKFSISVGYLKYIKWYKDFWSKFKIKKFIEMKQTLQLIIDDDLDFDKNYKKIYIHRFLKNLISDKKIMLIDYHWNNYEKLKKDYEYLDNFGKRLLSDLAVFLNKLHKVNHSSIFWEILLGEWLHSFCFQIFDRYEMLNNLDYNKFNYLLKIKKFSDKDMIFQTIDEHNNIFFIKDYNSYLFYKIIDSVPSLKSNFLITKKIL